MSVYARYSVTGPLVDNGDWLLVPVALIDGAQPNLALGEQVAAAFVEAGQITAILAGYGLTGGGSAGGVSLAADVTVLATKTDLQGYATQSHTHAFADVAPTSSVPLQTGMFVAYESSAGWVTRSSMGDLVVGAEPIGGWPIGSVGASLASKAASAHAHSAADISSGTLAYARLPVGSSASTVCAGNDPRLADARPPTSHTHPISQITGLNTPTAGPAPPYVFALTYNASSATWETQTVGLVGVGSQPLGGWPTGSLGAALSGKAAAAHKATHATGGSDPLTPADIGAAPANSPAISGNATFTAATGVPLTVTNTGTGNSFVVNDQANDTTPFVVDASGRVGVGTSSPTDALHVAGTIRATALTDGVTTKAVADIVSGALAGRATHINTKLTPTSATSGADGQLYWDDNYIYVRTAVGWKRAQLLGLDEAPASGGGFDQVKLTQAQYDALAVKDPDTLYVIVP